MAISAQSENPQNLIFALNVVFVRCLALVFLFFAIQYWLRLIGYYPGNNFQFDTMDVHWKIVGPVMAVICPLVALGLWGLFSWGIVVWIVAVAIEIAMYAGFQPLFGTHPYLLWFHGCTAAILLGFIIARRIKPNKK